MKKLLLFLLAAFLPMAVNAHDIEVPNGDGITIYYKFINDATELAVSFRGDEFQSFENEYYGNVEI